MAYEYRNRRPVKIPLPLVKKGFGAGDVIARMTKAIGIEPCPPCERRRRWLNSKIRFVRR